MSSIAKTITVFGGTGFLGKKICEIGVKRGHTVNALSSKGIKPVISGADWVDQVNWVKADIFKPESYRDILKETDAVVHSIGILLEFNNYKKVINSQSLSGVQSLINGNSNNDADHNPLNKTPGVSPESKYYKINTESALILAESIIQTKGQGQNIPFVYVSADQGFLGIPKGYIESKRTTELELFRKKGDLRSVILRPGFMYDSNDVKSVRSKLHNVLDCNILNRMGVVRPSIDIETVANSCIDKIENNAFSGCVSLDDMLGK